MPGLKILIKKNIRDGVKFSNGNDVTPSAIKACWDVLYANKTGSSNPSKFMDYESITADDEARTLTIVLKQAKADLRKDLAYPVIFILYKSCFCLRIKTC